MNKWTQFLSRVRQDTTHPECLLSLDPGETTGWAVFRHGELAKCGQIDPPDERLRIINLHMLISQTQPTTVVCENYRIYASKSDVHINSEVPVARLIGAIMLSTMLVDPATDVVFQSAGQAKGFCDNGKLKAWGLYQTAHRHSNDAIRHACYYLLFGGKNE